MQQDDEEMLTAYHEAGHAVIGWALGATIESIGLSQASAFDDDEGLPRRFGDCRVRWGKIQTSRKVQGLRELLTVLAGPIAEQIYSGEIGVADPSWAMDMVQAEVTLDSLGVNPTQRQSYLSDAVAALRGVMSDPACWSAIAALADELSVGDEMESEQVARIIRFWWRD